MGGRQGYFGCSRRSDDKAAKPRKGYTTDSKESTHQSLVTSVRSKFELKLFQFFL
jgi:hypothetical protein